MSGRDDFFQKKADEYARAAKIMRGLLRDWRRVNAPLIQDQLAAAVKRLDESQSHWDWLARRARAMEDDR